MTPILRYGVDSSLDFEPDSGKLLGQCGSPDVQSVGDVRAETLRALSEPLDYPPLAAMVTPGDRVAVALSDEVPAGSEIAAAVVECLCENRVDPEAITILYPAGSIHSDPSGNLPEAIRDQVVSLAYTPGEEEELAYLATTQHGEAIMLHRLLVDADLVIPIGIFRGHGAAGHFGMHTPIYPTFSDRKTQRRFHSTATLDTRGRHRKRLMQEADEVGWLLGLAFTIQVVPAPGDRVYCVLAGKNDAVRHRGMELLSQLWHDHIPHRAHVVLASIEGDASQQTWSNLGRVLEACTSLVEEGGGLAICTELADGPGSAIRCLREARFRDEALQQIYQDEADDAVAAIQLAKALDHCSVYLLSNLDDTLVEDLEMTPVADASDLVRLAGRSTSFLLLGNASYAHVSVEEASDD